MKIRTRFNLALLLVFVPGFVIGIWITHALLVNNAKTDVLANAGLMMETATSVRSYTVDHVSPRLRPLMQAEFLAETVPAFAAVETFARLQKSYPDYSYREATLNPTNLRNRATDWENYHIIRPFRAGTTSGATLEQLVGERVGSDGKRFLYIARPIRITNAACLACHSTPQAAPPALIKTYGDRHGFGWQLNEVVGAQIITVPFELAIQNAQRAVWAVSAVLLGLLASLFLVLNIMLDRVVIAPIRRVSQQSEQISLGNLDIPEFSERGAEEIVQLQSAFNRMRRSIQKAMRVVQPLPARRPLQTANEDA